MIRFGQLLGVHPLREKNDKGNDAENYFDTVLAVAQASEYAACAC